MAWTDAQKLAAIRARINGEWDHPALLKLGPLHPNRLADVTRILDGVEGPTDETAPEQEA